MVHKPKSHLKLTWLTEQSCVAFYPCLFSFIRRPTGIKTFSHLHACVYSRSLAFLTHTSALLSQAVNPLAGRDETRRSDEIGCNEEEKWLALWCASRVFFFARALGEGWRRHILSWLVRFCVTSGFNPSSSALNSYHIKESAMTSVTSLSHNSRVLYQLDLHLNAASLNSLSSLLQVPWNETRLCQGSEYTICISIWGVRGERKALCFYRWLTLLLSVRRAKSKCWMTVL